MGESTVSLNRTRAMVSVADEVQQWGQGGSGQLSVFRKGVVNRINRKTAGESTTGAHRAFDKQLTFMLRNDVFDNSQPKTGAPGCARPRLPFIQVEFISALASAC